MTETGTVTPVCDICGADIREGSDFCYNCGGSLTASAGTSAIDVKPAAPGSTSGAYVTAPAAAPAGDLEGEVSVKRPGSENGVAGKMRRPRPAHRSADREIVWEAEERGISPAMLIGTLVFVLVTAALLVAAYFIR